MDKIKILLTSDLHLGLEKTNPVSGRKERISTFKKISALAKNHDIFLMAGDIINHEYIDIEYLEIIKSELKKIFKSGTEIYYTPGTGELDSSGKLSESLSGLDNVFVFSDNNENAVKSEKGEIFIYGIQSGSSKNLDSITRKEKNGFHIGLFHADFAPLASVSGSNFCIGKPGIRSMNLDFYALGKSHSSRLFRSSDRILGAYPGSPEPCSLDEYGERYVISIEIEDNRIINVKRIPVNTTTVNNYDIDCSVLTNEMELIELVKNKNKRESINRIELVGTRSFLLSESVTKELTGFFRGLKIIDNSKISCSVMMEQYSMEDTLKGLFFRNLILKIKTDQSINISQELMNNIFYKKIRETEDILFCDS